jgi:hypothetical protein
MGETNTSRMVGSSSWREAAPVPSLLSRGRRLPIPRDVVVACVIAWLGSTSADAQAQDYQGKLTLGVYASDEQTTVDINARYSARDWTGWLGWYGPQPDVGQARAGLEYDVRRRHMLLIPSIQAASPSFVGGSIYSEIGQVVYAIAGVSRTDLKPYVNLNFDPNESWQLGAGVHFGRADSVAASTIWDNRLHTAQRNSHVVLRYYFAGPYRLTLDASYKSGRGDTGTFVRGIAVATEVDWRRWFVKAARDAHFNYSASTMWRFGGGMRF